MFESAQRTSGALSIGEGCSHPPEAEKGARSRKPGKTRFDEMESSRRESTAGRTLHPTTRCNAATLALRVGFQRTAGATATTAGFSNAIRLAQGVMLPGTAAGSSQPAFLDRVVQWVGSPTSKQGHRRRPVGAPKHEVGCAPASSIPAWHTLLSYLFLVMRLGAS
jgi:hypothetical protein